MKTYAYCRVSTQRQSLARQIENVTKVYPKAKIYTDKWTGKTMDRPNWNILYRLVKPGDLIVFDSVSRLSRDAESGAALYMELYERGIELKFLNEPHIDTSEYRQAANESVQLVGNEIADLYIEATNKVLKILARRQVVAAFEQAQKERDDIAKRVKDGMRAAVIKAAEHGEDKKYGAVEGKKLTTKKSIYAMDAIRTHSKDFGGSLNDSDCMVLAKCSRNSYYKYKAAIREEIKNK